MSELTHEQKLKDGFLIEDYYWLKTNEAHPNEKEKVTTEISLTKEQILVIAQYVKDNNIT